ncbi:MAG: T9SS type A sorting domain-containing protein, partial [Bacteroidota bacterium]
KNVSGQVHNDGLIIGGAFWDLRVATSLATARYLSHFAKYGTPDDADLGTAYGEWFVETLVADDDDGNLGNGTPHITQISNAFGAHGIGSALFFQRSFLHIPLASTYDTTNAYPVVFELEGAPIPGGGPDSARVHYTLNSFQTTQTLAATPIGQTTYRAYIPAQHGGTVVKYYITAYDRLSNTRFTFPTGAPATSSYGFLVGVHRAQAGVMYAASSSPTSRLYTINTSTGAATAIGSLSTTELQGLAIRPSTKEMFGTIATSSATTLYRVSPAFGDAFAIGVIPLGNLRAIAFASSDDLYGATTAGRLYRINLNNGDTTYVGTASGIIYSGLSFSPHTGRLYGSVRPPIVNRDRIYTVHTATGAAMLVGATGDNLITPSIAFSPNGVLYGLKGSGAQTNTLIAIDTTTGVGMTIGSTGLTGLFSIAMRTDSSLTSVESNENATLPASYELSQNYPNPFNPTTTIEYSLPPGVGTLHAVPAGRQATSLRVYDVLGREVATLVNGVEEPGYKSVQWDASGIASGVYLYELRAGSFTAVKRLLLLR